jgi:subtilisin family serine protease
LIALLSLMLSGEGAARADSAPTGRLLVSLRAPTHGPAHAAAVEAVTARTGALPDGPSVPQLDMITVRPRPGESLAGLARRLHAQRQVSAVTVERRFAYREVRVQAPQAAARLGSSTAASAGAAAAVPAASAEATAAVPALAARQLSLRDVPVALPNDPALSTLETAPGTPAETPIEWWADREGLPGAWSYTHGVGTKVGVIDSGVDPSQPDLASSIEYANDLDGEPGEGSATVDRAGHGTHVAGLACGKADNHFGIAGAGYDCRLIIEKSDLTEGSVIAAIVDATNHGAQVINMSFGTEGSGHSPQLEQAIRYAYRHNVVLVAAAADEVSTAQGDPAEILQPPGSGPQLGSGLGLTVASADFTGRRSLFSGYGSEISLAAYGSFHNYPSEGGPPGIFSDFPANPTEIESGAGSSLPPCSYCRAALDGNDLYAYLAGTSMAAPQVAGVAALVRQVAPQLSAGQVISLLEQTARRSRGSGWNAGLGWGILDAGAAVSAAWADAHPVQARRARRARQRYLRRSARCQAAHRDRRASRSSSVRCKT